MRKPIRELNNSEQEAEARFSPAASLTENRGNPVMFLLVGGTSFYALTGLMLVLGAGVWTSLGTGCLGGMVLGILAPLAGHIGRKVRPDPRTATGSDRRPPLAGLPHKPV